MSPIASIEERLAALEREVAEIKRAVNPSAKNDWFAKVAGSFKDDPEFDEVVRLGREIRRSEPFAGN
jgi:hypothetical protein